MPQHLDAAARELFMHTLARPGNRELRDAIERPGIERVPHAGVRDGALIVLVPGIFYVDYPHTGADGAVLHRVAAALGLPFATIPVDGTAGLDPAADEINAWLQGSDGAEPIVLFSLSKGSAEVRHALTKPEAREAFRDVIAWISVSGLPFGTPSFEIFLRNPLRRAFMRTLCKIKGWRLDRVRDLLRHRPAAPLVLPEHLALIQVAAFPAQADLRDRRSRWLQRELAPLGPNDGFAVLAELVALPGRFYPIWGADHYLRGIDDLPARIARLIDYVLAGQCTRRYSPSMRAASFGPAPSSSCLK